MMPSVKIALCYSASERSPAVIDAFLLQVRAFCREAVEAVDGLLANPATIGTDILTAVVAIEKRHKVGVQVIRHLIEIWRDREVPIDDGLRAIRFVARFIGAAVDPATDAKRSMLERAFGRIASWHPLYASMVRVCRISANEGSPHDHSWWAATVLSPLDPAIEINAETLQPRKVRMNGAGVTLFASQALVAQKLTHFLRLKRSAPIIAGIATRPIPLLVGPTGAGKTAVVRHFCEVNNLPLLELNAGGWLINGAYAKPATLPMAGQFIRQHEECVIFIDETDKFSCDSSDWMRAVQQEAMALLDCRINEMWGWSEEDRIKLIEKCLIIGAGTFQSLYTAKGRQLGFRDVAAEPEEAPIDLRTQSAIPEEILNRFNALTLFVYPPTREEVRDRIMEIHSELGSPPPSQTRLDALLHEAITTGQHARWIESYLARVLEEYSAAENHSQIYATNPTDHLEPGFHHT